MRKLLLLLTVKFFLFLPSIAQDGLLEFSRSYFRPDPLAVSFSAFLEQLLNDASLGDKQIAKRTDTSFFYFSATYKKYDRFFFKPVRVTISLQEEPVKYVDSLPPDTIFVYQLTAFADSSVNGRNEVKKEFERIHRIFRKKFYRTKYSDLDPGNSEMGGLNNFFVSYSTLAPLTTGWGELGAGYALQITLRFKTSSNRARLAAALYYP